MLFRNIDNRLPDGIRTQESTISMHTTVKPYKICSADSIADVMRRIFITAIHMPSHRCLMQGDALSSSCTDTHFLAAIHILVCFGLFCKTKVKLSPCHEDITARQFLTSAPDEDEWSPSRPAKDLAMDTD
jgi:hypothetical protein